MTPTQITREQCDEVIEHFNPNGYTHTLIGDVLEKARGYTETPLWSDRLVDKWKACGSLSKSLQEIRNEAEWEEKKLGNFKDRKEKGELFIDVLKPPAADLFIFLRDLISSR